MKAVRTILILVALAVSPATAQFFDLAITFEDIGCVSCVESLQGRLESLRGVEKAELDLKKGRVALELNRKNRVRLRTVLARITQDGTKILDIEAEAEGEIWDPGFVVRGTQEPFRVDWSTLEHGKTYRLVGRIELPDDPEKPPVFLVTKASPPSS